MITYQPFTQTTKWQTCPNTSSVRKLSTYNLTKLSSLSYLSAQLLHFTILRTAPMRKNIRMGSSRMYWDKVIQPVSAKRTQQCQKGLQFQSESKIAESQFPQHSEDKGNKGNSRNSSRSEYFNFYLGNKYKNKPKKHQKNPTKQTENSIHSTTVSMKHHLGSAANFHI